MKTIKLQPWPQSRERSFYAICSLLDAMYESALSILSANADK